MSQTTTTEKKRSEIVRIIPTDSIVEKATGTKWRVLQAFENVDFRFGHEGLYEVCKRRNIDLRNLEKGNCVIFFNSSKTQIKIAFSHEDIFHHRETTKLDIRVLDKIMDRLNSTGKISYPQALRDFIAERLKRKGIDVEDTRIN
jgi:hypothetical protein